MVEHTADNRQTKVRFLYQQPNLGLTGFINGLDTINVLYVRMAVMNNLVAKHARKFNKAVVMRDRKKDYSRKGKSKFQGRKVR